VGSLFTIPNFFAVVIVHDGSAEKRQIKKQPSKLQLCRVLDVRVSAYRDRVHVVIVIT